MRTRVIAVQYSAFDLKQRSAKIPTGRAVVLGARAARLLGVQRPVAEPRHARQALVRPELPVRPGLEARLGFLLGFCERLPAPRRALWVRLRRRGFFLLLRGAWGGAVGFLRDGLHLAHHRLHGLLDLDEHPVAGLHLLFDLPRHEGADLRGGCRIKTFHPERGVVADAARRDGHARDGVSFVITTVSWRLLLNPPPPRIEIATVWQPCFKRPYTAQNCLPQRQ